MSMSSHVRSSIRPDWVAVAVLASTAVAACGSSHASSTHPDAGSGSAGGAAPTSSSSGSVSSGTGGSDAGANAGNPDASITNPDAGISNPTLPRSITATNNCTFTLWADALPTTTFPGGLPVKLDPGQSFVAGVDNGWSGRVWGRFDCTTDSTGNFPSTLSELTLSQDQGTGLDFYDVSLVDGFDLPMALIAVGFTATAAQPYSCGAPTCAKDLRPTCPTPLQDVVNAQTLACANDECKVLGDNVATSPDCIYPNQYTEFFKTGCPQAYSFPSDDPTSTFTCKGKDYQVVFCP
jgi:hypothetical protein